MANPERRVSKIIAPDGTVFWADTRYFPIVSARTFGEVSVDLATTFGKWLTQLVDHAETVKVKTIVINDFSFAKVPPALSRKVMANDANRLQTREGFGFWVPVMPNPLMRGALTAVLWFVEGGDKRTHFVSKFADAMAKAQDLSRSIEQAIPDINPADYEFLEPELEVKFEG